MKWSELEEFHDDMLTRTKGGDLTSVPNWMKGMCVDKDHAQTLLNVIDQYMGDNKGMGDLINFYRDRGLETTPIELGVTLVMCHKLHKWDDEHIVNILMGFCKVDNKEDNECEEWKGD